MERADVKQTSMMKTIMFTANNAAVTGAFCKRVVLAALCALFDSSLFIFSPLSSSKARFHCIARVERQTLIYQVAGVVVHICFLDLRDNHLSGLAAVRKRRRLRLSERRRAKEMEYRDLGTTGLKVSAVGLGCMSMSWAYGTPDEAEGIKTIHRALDIGVNFLDTAEIYGPYTNEVLVGKALKGRRDKAIVATKFGFKIENGMITGADSHPKRVKEVADESLKRLDIDHIDLYYQHRVDPKIPIEETVGAMSELVEAGKIRYLGLSEAGPETLKRACKEHPIAALQSEYSLWERDLEERIIPSARELGIGIVAYSPVGRGLLTGQIKSFDDFPADDYRRNDPRYQGANFAKNLELVELVKQVGRKHGATPAQVAIAWLLMMGQDIVPIPGTKRVKYLEENSAAYSLKLEKEDLESLDRLAQKTSGERYEASRMALIER